MFLIASFARTFLKINIKVRQNKKKEKTEKKKEYQNKKKEKNKVSSAKGEKLFEIKKVQIF